MTRIALRLTAAGLGLLLLAGFARADVNWIGVGSFAVVVPDYSKTSGGSDPALSPDGKTLAFSDSNGEIRIIHNKLLCDLSNPARKIGDAWKLDFKSPGMISHNPGLDPRPLISNIDWSPDGKRLAFAYKDDRIYVAENFDYRTRKADVRPVFTPSGKTLPAGSFTSPGVVMAPRWSPDGKKIAFLVYNGGTNTINVLDLASSKEKPLARVYLGNDYDTLQPWSPDSKSLVYESCKESPMAGGGTLISPAGICVVQADSGKTRTLIKGGHLLYSSGWSPKSDLIAFTRADRVTYATPLSDIFKILGASALLQTMDSRGKNIKTLCGSVTSTTPERNARSLNINLILRSSFEQRFRSSLSAYQFRLLRKGKMALDEMYRIALLKAAKQVGGNLGNYIRANVRKLAQCLVSGNTSDPTAVTLGKLAMALPGDKLGKLIDTTGGFFIRALDDASRLVPGEADRPVWSPDGKRIAFLRNDTTIGLPSKLVVLDIATGREHTVLSAFQIGSFGWADGGKVLVAETVRLMGYNTADDYLGYHEIWLIEPL